MLNEVQINIDNKILGLTKDKPLPKAATKEQTTKF